MVVQSLGRSVGRPVACIYRSDRMFVTLVNMVSDLVPVWPVPANLHIQYVTNTTPKSLRGHRQPNPD